MVKINILSIYLSGVSITLTIIWICITVYQFKTRYKIERLSSLINLFSEELDLLYNEYDMLNEKKIILMGGRIKKITKHCIIKSKTSTKSNINHKQKLELKEIEKALEFTNQAINRYLKNLYILLKKLYKIEKKSELVYFQVYKYYYMVKELENNKKNIKIKNFFNNIFYKKIDYIRL